MAEHLLLPLLQSRQGRALVQQPPGLIPAKANVKSVNGISVPPVSHNHGTVNLWLVGDPPQTSLSRYPNRLLTRTKDGDLRLRRLLLRDGERQHQNQIVVRCRGRLML